MKDDAETEQRTLSIRVDKELHKQIKQLARKDGRTISGFKRIVLDKIINELESTF